MREAHFGVTVPQIKRPWVAAAEAARSFENLGYDSLWVCDHLYGPQSPQLPILEAWSMVSALAAITERVEIGTLVTPAGMRNPAQLGKVIAHLLQIGPHRRHHVGDGVVLLAQLAQDPIDGRGRAHEGPPAATSMGTSR